MAYFKGPPALGARMVLWGYGPLAPISVVGKRFQAGSSVPLDQAENALRALRTELQVQRSVPRSGNKVRALNALIRDLVSVIESAKIMEKRRANPDDGAGYEHSVLFKDDRNVLGDSGVTMRFAAEYPYLLTVEVLDNGKFSVVYKLTAEGEPQFSYHDNLLHLVGAFNVLEVVNDYIATLMGFAAIASILWLQAQGAGREITRSELATHWRLAHNITGGGSDEERAYGYFAEAAQTIAPKLLHTIELAPAQEERLSGLRKKLRRACEWSRELEELLGKKDGSEGRAENGGIPTVKSLLSAFGHLPPSRGKPLTQDDAKRLRRMMEEAEGYDAVDAALAFANKALDGNGVEAIQGKWHDHYYRDIVLLYVNLGETYQTTLRYNTVLRSFSLGSWGDFVEGSGKKYQIR